MRKKALITMILLPALLLFGCTGKGTTDETDVDAIKIDGIKAGSINEFYYTYENINYNACYQRY
ncbi:MAG: hypothetical protein II099_00590, partial [Firmicutes bacterium]|nr:hypothetical protein [Bacillota bacterium]